MLHYIIEFLNFEDKNKKLMISIYYKIISKFERIPSI